MFEIHVTVKTNNIPQFKADCETLGVKAIVIEVQNDVHSSQQVMTSSKYNHMNFHQQLIELSEGLKVFGYVIERLKVEVHPDHLLGYPDVKYFESHIRVKCNSTQLNLLKSFASENEWYTSKNIFKRIDDHSFYMMLTYRTSTLNSDQFKTCISEFYTSLELAGFELDKLEIEACVLDTNEELDKQWLNL